MSHWNVLASLAITFGELLTSTSGNHGQANTTDVHEITFSITRKGEQITKEGRRRRFTRFQSSTGNVLFHFWMSFHSRSDADKQIQNLKTTAIKLLRNEAETNKDGQTVGNRVLLLCEDVNKQAEIALGWNDGAIYEEVRSASLDDVLAFERLLRGGPPNDLGNSGRLPLRTCSSAAAARLFPIFLLGYSV